MSEEVAIRMRRVRVLVEWEDLATHTITTETSLDIEPGDADEVELTMERDARLRDDKYHSCGKTFIIKHTHPIKLIGDAK